MADGQELLERIHKMEIDLALQVKSNEEILGKLGDLERKLGRAVWVILAGILSALVKFFIEGGLSIG